jgi:hypothetical protein
LARGATSIAKRMSRAYVHVVDIGRDRWAVSRGCSQAGDFSKSTESGPGARSPDAHGVQSAATRMRLRSPDRNSEEERAMPTEGQAKASESTRDLTRFDYKAPAELFPSRTKRGARQMRYRRFDTAAEALQFAIEQMPPPVLLGAFLEVEEERFSAEEMRSLYSSAAYPLARSEAES